MTDENKAYNILLVEDNPHEALLTKTAFEQADSELGIHTVSNGEEALEYIIYRGSDKQKVAPLDLILLDLSMPKVDGMTVLNVLKTNSRSAGIPIIVLSGSKERKDVFASFQSGAVSYINKPVDYPKCSKAIKELITYWRTLGAPTEVS